MIKVNNESVNKVYRMITDSLIFQYFNLPHYDGLMPDINKTSPS